MKVSCLELVDPDTLTDSSRSSNSASTWLRDLCSESSSSWDAVDTAELAAEESSSSTLVSRMELCACIWLKSVSASLTPALWMRVFGKAMLPPWMDSAVGRPLNHEPSLCVDALCEWSFIKLINRCGNRSEEPPSDDAVSDGAVDSVWGGRGAWRMRKTARTTASVSTDRPQHVPTTMKATLSASSQSSSSCLLAVCCGVQ